MGKSRAVRSISPQVKFHYLQEPEHIYSVLNTAISMCYDKSKKFEALDILPVTSDTIDKFKNKLYHCLDSGHTSVIEHVSFSFTAIMSRAASHQLVRHRIASYSQRSQRYTDYEESVPVVVPLSILEDDHLQEEYLNTILCIINTVDSSLDIDEVPFEDRRFLYPNAVATKIFFTMNARALGNFLQLRLCHRAQWEIRTIAVSMLHQLTEHYPILFNHKYFRKKCEYFGDCTEKHPCVTKLK